VTATESSAELFEKCRQSLQKNDVTFIHTEANKLAEHNVKVDMIFVAQKFNLLDAEAVKDNFKKCLNENGLVVLAWNNKNKEKIFQDLTKLILESCDLYSNEMYQYDNNYAAGCHSKFFKNTPDFIKLHSDVEHYIDEETFMERCLSASYAPTKDNSKYVKFESALRKFFRDNQKDELIYYPLETTIFIGEI
jgi:protein-L-isoaspartate O-methyltransferase